MAFDVAAESYDRFMGRYSIHLSPQLADLAGVREGQRVLDVGCGPGQLTGELVARVGAESVVAVDPSDKFVEAARERNPGVDVRLAAAEDLPFEDDTFDAALAQLVVHFMADPVAGLREMARVTRPGGAVAASVWDLGGGRAPLSPFWRAARRLHPAAEDEAARAGARQGDLAGIFEKAGLTDVRVEEHRSASRYESFDEWWVPYTLGVGPAGAFASSRSEDELAAIREECLRELPEAPFEIVTVAWAVRGTV